MCFFFCETKKYFSHCLRLPGHNLKSRAQFCHHGKSYRYCLKDNEPYFYMVGSHNINTLIGFYLKSDTWCLSEIVSSFFANKFSLLIENYISKLLIKNENTIFLKKGKQTAENN